MTDQRISIEEGFRLLRLDSDEACEEVNRLIRLAEAAQNTPADPTEWTDTVCNTPRGEPLA